ncbi:MAG TPA: XRE family transcriptional regulator [Sphingomicrobium sp.]|nr:XRE family transcriptional regulator [Sphingomicrobium sp.]
MCGLKGADAQRAAPVNRRPALGRVLRDIRNRRGWTLRETSARVGIAVSSLSKIENNRLTLTYDKLFELSRKLDVPVSELFMQVEPAETAVTGRRSIGRQQDAARISAPGYDRYYLCAELKRKRMTPMLTRIRAKSPAEVGGLERHSGEEYIHVIDGSIAVHTEYYEAITVSAGEGIYIDSTMGHAFVAAEGCDEAVVLGICSN